MNKICKCKTDCHCRNIYELAVLEGRAAGMSLSQYLDSIEGTDGSPGMRGASAFAVWLEQPGNEGKTIDEFWDFLRGVAGEDGQSVFNSIVFKRVQDGVVPDKPVGGNYLNPLPTDTTWSDGVPAGEGTLYMSNRTFTSNGLPPQTIEWAVPVIAADSQYIDIEWSSVEFNPGTPDTIPDNWSNEAEEDSYWMALRVFKSGYWNEWNIIRVKGEKGDKGNPGDVLEIRFQKNTSFSIPPTLDSTIRNPDGWQLEPPTLNNGEYLWQIQAIVSQETNALVDTWSNPIRITGEKGTDGPSLVFRGDWKSDGEYYGGETFVELVRYTVNGKGYIARTDVGSIPVGTVPTNTDYWNEIPLNIDAIFTDFIFAYSGYIQDLTVGQVQTAIVNERTTIGFKPVETADPSRNLSKHGLRYYDTDGKLSLYLGADNSGRGTLISYYTFSGITDKVFELQPWDRRLIFYKNVGANRVEGFAYGADAIINRDGDKITLSNVQTAATSTEGTYSLGMYANGTNNGVLLSVMKNTLATAGYGTAPAVEISSIRPGDSPGSYSYTGVALKVNGKIQLQGLAGSVVVGTEVGYTGTINGAKFVNGICVGPA